MLSVMKSLILAEVKRVVYIIFVLLLGSFISKGQQYFFQSYGQEQGLPVSTVNDIVEDDLGFMWIATEGGGLVRFDGQNAEVFTVDQGLTSNYVTSLIYRSDEGLLIGTDKGLMFYNGRQFTQPYDVPEERIFSMSFCGDTLFVIQRRSLCMVLPSGEVETLNAPGNPELMTVACGNGVYVGASDGLWKLEGRDWIKWWDGQNVRSIYISTDTEYSNAIQVGAADDVYLILRKGFGIRNLSSGVGHSETHPDVRDIVHDNFGRWWYGSYQSGLRRYDASQEDGYGGVSITESQGLTTPKVRCMYVSRDGRIWIGGLSGLSRLVEPDLFRYTVKDGLSDESVHALCISKNGDWWMGGISGLTRKSRNGNFRVFTEKEGVPTGLIFDIEETENGELWIASENGLAKKNGDKFQIQRGQGDFKNAFVFDIDVDLNGDLILATTQGIYRYDGSKYSLEDPNLKFTAFTRVHVDEVGGLWVLDLEGRIMVRQKEEWKYPLPESAMLRMSISTFQIQENVLWMATNGHGLWRLEGSRLDSITSKEGLISDNVWSLNVVDNDAWIGSEKGIQNVLWKNGWNFGSRVSEARGFGSMECNAHSVQRSDRYIAFGTNQGVLVAPLRSKKDLNSVGVIQLLRLDLYFQQPETWKMWTDTISPWIGMPLSLKLPYDQNYLRLIYAGMGVADPKALLYQYKLSPLNQEWTVAGKTDEAIFTNLPAGKYTFEVKAYDPLSGNELAAEPYSFEIKPPFWKTWWFYVSAFLFIAGSIVAYVRIRLRRIRNIMALQEERNDLERRALRLQMNPHFVFNALDAISGFIFKNEPKEAVKYLNSFAKLMRLTLESSREHLIPVHTEIQLLENYLALEKLRFSGQFESEIVLEDDLDPYGYSMPSMMIQPHVENAILHGLRPKGGGKVSIHFEKIEKALRVTIEDNGVGRTRAAEIQAASGRDHRSLAGEISRRRVELFEKTFGGKSAVLVQDLFDEHGNPMGTRVILQLPVQSTDEWDDE